MNKAGKSVAMTVFTGVLLCSITSAVLAAPPNSPYEPGETISPTCEPGSQNCTVRHFARAGANSDITSLTGLTTPLSILQGGTGLSLFNSLGLLYASGSSTIAILGGGQNGNILKLVNGNVEWANEVVPNISNLFSTSSSNFWLNQKTSDDLIQGITNKFYSTQLLAADLAATTTDALHEGTSNLFFSNSRVNDLLAGINKNYFFSTSSAAYFLGQNISNAFSTSSASYWLSQLSTDNLTQGLTNKFYSTQLLAADLAATTTNAIREGAGNLYFTFPRADARINATTTIGTLTSLPNLSTLGTISSGTWHGNPIDATQYIANLSTPFSAFLRSTSTDALLEGSINKYYSNSQVQTFLNSLSKDYFFSTTSATYFLTQNLPNPFSTSTSDYWLSLKTTDNLTQGPTNKFYATQLFARDLAGTTTDALREGTGNLFFTNNRVTDILNGLSKNYFFSTSSASYFLGQNLSSAFSTTSNNYWLSQINTDNLTQGLTNKFYSAQLFATDLAATTTDALREGSANKFYTDLRVGSYISSSSTIPSVVGSVAGNTLAWNGSRWISVATTTFNGPLTYSGGSVTINNNTISNNLLANSAITLSSGSGLTGGGSVSLGGSSSLSLNLANPNSWTGLQQFNNGASTTVLSISNKAYFGGTATSTFSSNGDLSLAGALTAGSTFVVNQATGKVGIGSSSPSKTLSINGTLAISGLTGLSGISGNALCLSPSGTGEVLLNGAVSCLLSSGRYKHDIATSSTGLDLVNALRPVTFYFNADTGNKDEQFGFIAEEVGALDRRLVDLDETGIPKTVRYEEFTSILAKAIQDLDKKINLLASSTMSFGTASSSNQLCVKTTCLDQDEFVDMVETYRSLKSQRSQSSTVPTLSPTPQPSPSNALVELEPVVPSVPTTTLEIKLDESTTTPVENFENASSTESNSS